MVRICEDFFASSYDYWINRAGMVKHLQNSKSFFGLLGLDIYFDSHGVAHIFEINGSPLTITKTNTREYNDK